MNSHDLPNAVSEFREAVKLLPNDPAGHDFLGVAFAESGQPDVAAKEFEEATRLNEDFAQAHFHLAMAYDQLGRASDAVREYETTLRLEPNSIDARYALSAACWKLRDYGGAIELLRQVLKQNPTFAAEAHYNLGLELKQVGKLDEAAKELQTAVGLQADSVKYRSALCQILTENLVLDDAINTARETIELAPNNPEPYYDLAEASRLKGDLATAESQFDKVLELNPKFPRAHRQLGLVLRQKGSYEAAAAQLEEAVKEDPADAEVRYFLGSVLLKLNDNERALQNLTESIRLDPYDSAARTTFANALSKAGREAGAAEERKNAQLLDELKANAGRSRILLASAEGHLNKGEADAALADLRNAAQLSPEYPDVQFQLARALQMKRAPAAEIEKALRRVIESEPEYAQAHLELGLLLESEGQKERAREELRRAESLAPSLVEAHRALGRLAVADKDWRTAVFEFGAILAWKENDRDARHELNLALAQHKAHSK